MALIVKDRVLETCSTSGLVDFTLTGAVTGYQRFSAIGNGNTTYYAAYVIGSNDWEVGIGTVGTSSLTRDTILSSSTGSKVNFAGNPVVWCDLPSSKAIFGDANNNISVNSIFEGFTSVGASGTQIVLTASSTPYYLVTGSGGQTIKLPDATTLPLGAVFDFNNNQSSGAITVNNNSNTLVASIPSGGYTSVILTANSTAAGSWDRHDQAPSNVSWSTNTLDYPGSITSATWNGSTVAYNRGGTGQSSAFVAGGIVYGASTSALGVNAVGTTGQILTSQGASAPTWSSILSPSQILLNQSYDQGTGVLQAIGQSTFNGAVIDKSLNLQGGNNLFTYSQDFSNGAWTKNNATITTGASTAPDGTLTFNKLTEDTSNSTHRIYFATSTTPSNVYTLSCYAKASQRNYLALYVDTTGGGNKNGLIVNLTTGAISSTLGTVVNSQITSLGNSIYRVAIAITATNTTSYPVLGASANGTTDTYTGDGTSGIFIWGAQFELGTIASNYTVTTTSTITTTNNIIVPSGSVSISNGNLNIQRPIATLQVAPTIASAATIAPTSYITFISGVTTINTITAPSPLSTYGGQIVLIPTGLFSTGVVGNIAIATTAVVSRALIMVYDTTTAKWYPSY